jgi:hypothetical protein
VERVEQALAMLFLRELELDHPSLVIHRGQLARDLPPGPEAELGGTHSDAGPLRSCRRLPPMDGALDSVRLRPGVPGHARAGVHGAARS